MSLNHTVFRRRKFLTISNSRVPVVPSSPEKMGLWTHLCFLLCFPNPLYGSMGCLPFFNVPYQSHFLYMQSSLCHGPHRACSHLTQMPSNQSTNRSIVSMSSTDNSQENPPQRNTFAVDMAVLNHLSFFPSFFWEEHPNFLPGHDLPQQPMCFRGGSQWA